MGHFYAQMLFGIEAPRVGLLSIGEEEGKGNELTKETFRVLKETGLNFIGNAEGRDVYNGNADVVVCDGFIGNVVLKASESLGEMVKRHDSGGDHANADAQNRRADGQERLRQPQEADGLFRSTAARRSSASTAAASSAHGRSNAKAIKNAIRVARDFAVNRMDTKIQEKVGDLHRREHELNLPAEDLA